MMSVRSSNSVSVSTTSILTNLQNNCATPLPILRHVTDDMRAGLAVDGGSSLKMILSYVNSLPTGFWRVGVLRVQLGGKSERVDTEFDQVSIPKQLMFGTERFSFPSGKKREIGFTFSFPVKQTAIDSGILIKWTKGFAVSGTRGKDVVACLKEEMERQGLDMRVSALVNDSVGTLAGARYWDDNVMVAWGAFSKGLPLSEFDKDMDDASINPGEQIFEKTISGMYLCEIVRRVLVKMAELGDLFGESIPHKLSTPLVLRTPDLCAMQQDNSCDLIAVGSILSNKFESVEHATPSLCACVIVRSVLSVLTLNSFQVSVWFAYCYRNILQHLNTRKTVVEVIDTIVKRGGRLAGAGIVRILQKREQDSKGLIFGKRTVAAMDGGLYKNYPQYREYLQDAITELLGSDISKNVVIEHSKDGSGFGAALLAASNSKYAKDYRKGEDIL
ncbi:hypothetical protein MKX01_039087 [Papaver californicum]|nr:hypothetical protein MKX01_039087 [Papaver californicum]